MERCFESPETLKSEITPKEAFTINLKIATGKIILRVSFFSPVHSYSINTMANRATKKTCKYYHTAEK